MILNVISWNTQGAAVKKITVAQKYLLTNKDINTRQKSDDVKNILLIQEAGTANIPTAGTIGEIKFGRTKYCGYFAQQEGAINKRCTTGIFADEELIYNKVTQFGTIAVRRPEKEPEPVDIKASEEWRSDSKKTSKEPRPVVTFQVNYGGGSFILATIHATAYQPVARGEIEYICSVLQGSGKEWILMGDFNCEPQALKKDGVPGEQMSFAAENTHQSRRSLDYAVFSRGFIGKINVNVGMPGSKESVPTDSDHWPVYFQLKL